MRIRSLLAALVFSALAFSAQAQVEVPNVRFWFDQPAQPTNGPSEKFVPIIHVYPCDGTTILDAAGHAAALADRVEAELNAAPAVKWIRSDGSNITVMIQFFGHKHQHTINNQCGAFPASSPMGWYRMTGSPDDRISPYGPTGADWDHPEFHPFLYNCTTGAALKDWTEAFCTALTTE